MRESAAPEVPSAPIAVEPSLSRQILINTFFNLGGRFTYVLGWLLLAPYMLRALGAERFGIWALLSMMSGLSASVDLGLSGSLTRFVAEFRATGDARSLRGVWTIGVVLYAGLGVLAMVLVIAFRAPLLRAFRVTPALLPEASTALIAAGAVYLLLNATALVSSVLNGLHRLDLWNRILMLTTVQMFIGVWLVLERGGGLAALILNGAVALLTGVALGLVIIHRLVPDLRLDRGAVSADLARRLTRFSVALQLINLGVLAQWQFAKVLFGTLLSLTAVASYELALRVSSAAWSLPYVLLPPLLPAAAHLDVQGDRPRLLRLYHRSSRYLLAIALPLSCTLAVLSPALFVTWLGGGHEDAALAMAALALMLGASILTGVGTTLVRGIGKPWLEVRYQLLSLALFVGLGVVLTRTYGFPGGLAAMVISTVVGVAYFLWMFHREVGDPLLPFLGAIVLPPAVAGVCGALVGRWIGAIGDPDLQNWSSPIALMHLVAGAGAALAVSAGLMFAFRFIRVAECAEILALLMRRVPVARPEP